MQVLELVEHFGLEHERAVRHGRDFGLKCNKPIRQRRNLLVLGVHGILQNNNNNYYYYSCFGRAWHPAELSEVIVVALSRQAQIGMQTTNTCVAGL